VSPAWGLRRTAVGRAPRATSTPPRAALPRLASYNGTLGATVGRASTARLSTPRQPTPKLSGTCLTSAERPPLRGMLATEWPGHPEGSPAQRWTVGVFYWPLCASNSSGHITRKSCSENPRGFSPVSSTAAPPHSQRRTSVYITSTADTAMADPSTAITTIDIALNTPFVALRKPFAPCLCSLRCYARSCIRTSENSSATHSGE
jgi:hypothetical protein